MKIAVLPSRIPRILVGFDECGTRYRKTTPEILRGSVSEGLARFLMIECRRR